MGTSRAQGLMIGTFRAWKVVVPGCLMSENAGIPKHLKKKMFITYIESMVYGMFMVNGLSMFIIFCIFSG
jgi:hypothetical protein